MESYYRHFSHSYPCRSCGGAAQIKKMTGAKLHVPEKAVPYLEKGDEDIIDLPDARQNGFYPRDFSMQSIRADFPLKADETIKIGPYVVRVISTPGHSQFDTSYAVTGIGGKRYLFVGDTVFQNGKISMLSTHDFDLIALKSSIAVLAGEKSDMLLPGHGAPVLSHGSEHIRKAHRIFKALGVPVNIVE